MEKTIWKFVLKTIDKQELEMPYESEMLTVQTQHGIPCLWALVNPEADKEVRHFEIFGTGHPITCDMGIVRAYIGTYQIDDGALIFHVFENIGIPPIKE